MEHDRGIGNFCHDHVRAHLSGRRPVAEPATSLMSPEEAARRQKSCLAMAYSVGRFLSDARWGGSWNTHVLLETPRRALSFSRLFRRQNKIPLIGGIYR